MSQINLGQVRGDEYFNIYPSFQTAINGLDTYGGYKTYNGICYIFMQAICTSNTTVTFPSASETLDLYYQINNTMQKFSTELSFAAGDYIVINVMYEVSQ